MLEWRTKSPKEIVKREGIDNSCVSRMVNLVTLAPDIAAAVLDDALPNRVTLFNLAVDPLAPWDEQRPRDSRRENRVILLVDKCFESA